MGVVRKVQAGKMRVFIAVIAVIALAAASDFTPEEIMLEAQTDVADMKKKGATEKDCKDLAKTSCKEVVNEHTRSQKLINSLSTGSKCKYLGRGGIVKMLAHYRRTKKTWMSMKIKVSVASKAYVKIDSQRFSSLKQGKCGFVFSSRSYLTARARYQRAFRLEISWRSRTSEAHKMYIRAKVIAAKMVKRCHCTTKATAMKLWKTVTKKSVVARQNKAYAKCKMMACVLKGTKLSSKQCIGKLTAYRMKILSRDTKRAVCGRGKEKAHKKHKEAADKRAEKARAKEGALKKFKEKNQKGREKAKKKEAKMKAAEKKNKEKSSKAERHRKKAIALARAKREKAAKAERRRAVERQSKERRGKRNSYHLAMVINGGTNTFNYNSALWTNGRVGNFGHGNKKTGWVNKRARTIPLVMRYGRNTRSVTWRHNTNLSLTQLFKGGFRRTGINIHSWRHLGGNNVFGYQNHCNHQGFNAIARGGNFQKTDIRFGIVMNQENNCGTPDSSIGIGMKDAGVTAGGNCRCCNNGGHCGIKKAWAYVYVREA